MRITVVIHIEPDVFDRTDHIEITRHATGDADVVTATAAEAARMAAAAVEASVTAPA